MKIKLSILPLLVLAGSSCFGLTNDGRKLKEAFRLANFSGPTNRYAWVCPSNVTVSNQVFTFGRIWQSEGMFYFDLLSADGTRLGNCAGKIAVSSEEALNAMCDRMMYGCAAPVETVRSAWPVDRDPQGNVVLKSYGRGESGEVVWDRSEIFRTYGNLYFNVSIKTNRTSLSALDFALPLIHAGLQTR
ncbi:MAG: hypothetical protein MJ249_12280 [Kiritimatiellae bacterium]|nr:hypothetical protein [Kiritimatiellia bacterium]